MKWFDTENTYDISLYLKDIIRGEQVMKKNYSELEKELDGLETGKSQYVWDELEEIITDCFEEEAISCDEFDILMKRLMAMNCE